MVCKYLEMFAIKIEYIKSHNNIVDRRLLECSIFKCVQYIYWVSKGIYSKSNIGTDLNIFPLN